MRSETAMHDYLRERGATIRTDPARTTQFGPNLPSIVSPIAASLARELETPLHEQFRFEEPPAMPVNESGDRAELLRQVDEQDPRPSTEAENEDERSRRMTESRSDATVLTESLDALEAELDRQYDDTEPFGGLDGGGYKRVRRARDGIGAIRRYLDWRESEG